MIDIAADSSSSREEEDYTPVGARNMIHPCCIPYTDDETLPFHVQLRQQTLLCLTVPGVEDTPSTGSVLDRINTLLSSFSAGAGGDLQAVERLMTWIEDFRHLFNGEVVATIEGLIKTLKRHAASARMPAGWMPPAWLPAAHMPAAQLPAAWLPTTGVAQVPVAVAELMLDAQIEAPIWFLQSAVDARKEAGLKPPPGAGQKPLPGAGHKKPLPGAAKKKPK